MLHKLFRNKKTQDYLAFKTLNQVIVMFLQQEKGYLFFSLIKTVIGGVLPLVFVVFPAAIVGELTGNQRANRLLLLLIMMVVIHFVLSVFNSLLEASLLRSSERINRSFFFRIAQKSMALPYDMMEDIEQIDRIRIARDGLDRIGGITYVVNRFFELIQSILTIAGSIIIVTTLDIWLIILAVVCIVLHTVVQSRLKKIDMEFWNSMVGYNTRFFYVVSVILNRRYAKDIRIYKAQQTFIRQMESFITYISKEFKIKSSRQSRFNLLSYLVDSIQQIVIFGYLSWKLISGIITLGSFIMYFGAIQSFTTSTVKAMEVFLDLLQSSYFISHSIRLLDTEIPVSENNKLSAINKPCFEFEGVSFRYPGQERFALNNVNLRIPYGHKLCVVGMNGAGKTTLIKLLLRLYKPTDGRILLNGKDIQMYDFDEYTQLFSSLFQDYKLLAATIQENITLGRDTAVDQVKDCLQKAGLLERVESMKNNMETLVFKLFDPDGVDLSGGEAQKLAIARALNKDALVLILDEPTASLDPRMEHEIYSGFHKMVKSKTAIYISHRMTSCLFSDSIAVFDSGQLIQYGTHEDLINQSGKYAEMFQVQAQYYLKD